MEIFIQCSCTGLNNIFKIFYLLYLASCTLSWIRITWQWCKLFQTGSLRRIVYVGVQNYAPEASTGCRLWQDEVVSISPGGQSGIGPNLRLLS